MDLAAITTIHGFCQRLLAEHALEAGQPLSRTRIVPANAAQRSALAVELWRAHARTDAAGADFLQRWFGGLEALADALPRPAGARTAVAAAPSGDASHERDARMARAARALPRDGEPTRASALADRHRKRILSSAKDKAIPLERCGTGSRAQADARRCNRIRSSPR